MTTARTTTAQPIAASISIPDAILHSTAFARRKPLLLLKIVRQTDPRFNPASPGGAAGRRTAQTAASEKPVRAGFGRAFPSATRKRHGRKDAPTKPASACAGKRRAALQAAHSAPQSLCACAGTGTALRCLFFQPPAVPPPQSAAGEPPEACRPRPPSCTAVRILSGLTFSASPPHPAALRPSLSCPAFLRHASHSLPHSAFPAASDISLRARLYFAECRVFRNAAQPPPSASSWLHTRFPSTHVRASPSPALLQVAAQALTAVLNVFSCARRS